MANSILRTKLFIPPSRAECVLRPRLLERLDNGLAQALIVLSAPAGFGKTTLLVDWIRQRGLLAAWLTLDEADNDLARFLVYLASALQSALPHMRFSSELLQQAVRPMAAELALAELVNELADLDRPLLLILDDYHTIGAAEIHAVLGSLLDHRPPHLHLVLAARSDPPLPLARWRGRGQLCELHAADLRFSRDEAAEFLNRVMKLDLRAGHIAALEERTEGWVAGLQMLALALQASAPAAGAARDEFVRLFSGSHRYILDYLLEEVWQRQPPDVQSFLLQTSILERLSASLCEALLAGEAPPGGAPLSGQAILEYLERSNLFLIPLDDQREWYRYHHLFADLLQRQLSQRPDLHAQALHQRASGWFKARGLLDEAIEHALLAEDFESAAGLIHSCAQELMMRSQFATLARWINALPIQVLSGWPDLRVYRLWTMLFPGQSLRQISTALQELTETGETTVARLAPLHAYLAIYQGRLDVALQQARLALDTLPAEERFLRSIAAWILKITEVSLIDRAAAAETLERTLQEGQSAGNALVSVMTLCSLSDVYLSQGHLSLARETCQRAIRLSVDASGNLLPVAGIPMARLGEILREENNLPEAEAMLHEGMRCMRSFTILGVVNGLSTLALVQQARGEPSAANQSMQEAVQLASEYDATQIDDRFVSLLELRLRLIQGDLEYARGWLERYQSRPDEETSLYAQIAQERERIYVAWILTLLQRPREAVEILEPMRAGMERAGRRRRLVEVETLLSLAWRVAGQPDQAQQVLESALSQSEASGFVRMFLDLGPEMCRMLAEFRAGLDTRKDYPERQRLSGYCARLLAAFGSPTDAGLARPLPGLLEPLSKREQEVLRLLSGSLSVPEMASTLYLAESTVRSHIKNIYAKLGAHRRPEAVERARDLGLLPS